ncbi:MAG TPA: glutamate-5-semialdehyde dehydrogenase [bacterium]|nr:glutamate-5-semialdehyde dehydrogenase [bacterium]HOL94729.1 glutamate-5-semialdehyde dehydrogenase [bacterium]HPO99409.1 glutamate-5-semialdehyde dehydrogenase [bacterium]
MAVSQTPPIPDVEAYVQAAAREAKAASVILARTSTRLKNQALVEAARRIRERQAELQAQNQLDLDAGKEKGLSAAMLDRLALTGKRLEAIAAMLEEVATLPDPVGEITGMTVRPNGMRVGRMRVPLGVIGLIYESRPNVTADAAALCLKSGNACLLRGGSEAIHSNLALARLLQGTLVDCGLPPAAVSFIETTDREAVRVLCRLRGLVDVIIPRGGKSLIETVVELATIPVLKHYDGNCHVYVDEHADPAMAHKICLNAKIQRPGVCNAAETFLIHKAHSGAFLKNLLEELHKHGVEVRGCEKTRALYPAVHPATEADWDTEYLDLIVAVKIVESFDEALEHLGRHSSRHTDAIVTNDYAASQRFLREVDSSSVMVNASTRFSDGGEYGLGAEMGISTDKLHARGPMGLVELTCQKFIVLGDGHIRE